MARVVFSKDLFSAWGTDLASTLVADGQEKMFLDLFEAMASHPAPHILQDGDVLQRDGCTFMVLALRSDEQSRLSSAREHMLGAPGRNMMICERSSDLVETGILTQEEFEDRRARDIQI